MRQRKKLFVKGLVQGVGFRPFVFRLAQQYGLGGWVLNNENGVEIEIEGASVNLDHFSSVLFSQSPNAVQIESITEEPVSLQGETVFEIKKSQGQGNESVLISPDLATCPNCKKEMTNRADRRFQYPFINCVNCGPRYTIILDVPYDRPATTMKKFNMCQSCRKEYQEPLNRRFHAQPNACPVCGPRCWLVPGGKTLKTSQIIANVRELLLDGQTVAIKGLGGFHLAADACDSPAVSKLRQGKERRFKPFAVMVGSVEVARKFCQVSSEEAQLLESTAAPIVLLKSLKNNFLADEVAPKLGYHGVMLPYTPLHNLIIEAYPNPLIMSSGNLNTEPIVYENEMARKQLGGIVDHFLLHHREIYIPCDDSVARIFKGRKQLLRRSRGYVPMPFRIKGLIPAILAVGAEERNAICLTKTDNAFLSHHLADLKNMRSYLAFEAAVLHLKKVLGVRPKVVVHDLHPEYLSTKYAFGLKSVRHIAVQHHFAHIASCMAEHNIRETVIGLAMDGGGCGTDDTVWGGEFLLVSPDRFERMGFFKQLPLPGGAQAVREAWRMAYSYLYKSYGNEFWELPLELLTKMDRRSWPVYQKIIDKQLNSPLTSSLGRFFDAISSLLGVCDENTYSGQAAIELEMIAELSEEPPFDFELEENSEGQLVVNQLKVFKQIVQALIKGQPKPVLAYRFHRTLAHIFLQVCQAIHNKNGINKVCLGGGVFQNLLLQSLTVDLLEKSGFKVYWSEETPMNDGGISLGQAWIASNILQEKVNVFRDTSENNLH